MGYFAECEAERELYAELDRERWLRWCDAWIAIGVTAEAVQGAAEIASQRGFWSLEDCQVHARRSMAFLMGIPAEEAK